MTRLLVRVLIQLKVAVLRRCCSTGNHENASNAKQKAVPERAFHTIRAASARSGRRLMDTWCGHFPITGFVLQALLKKEAQTDAEELSRAEGILLRACQFWAAVARRELARYLDSMSVARLRVAFEAFSEIGAVRVASALRVSIADFPQAPSAEWLSQQASQLEVRLLDIDESVDQLIAKFAAEHFSHGSSEDQTRTADPQFRLAHPGN
jgi:hypothetical protein